VNITDILLLGPEELKIVCDNYPTCKVNKLTDSEALIQQYELSINDEDEEEYYEFLLDNCIAMSSHNFYSKIKSDKKFCERMKQRI
jgi:hypothetical protein